VWDTKTSQAVKKLSAKKGGWWINAPATAFSPDGRLLATTDEALVRLWAVDGWKPFCTLPAYSSWLAFSPDGRMLATVDLNDVTVWEVATGAKRFVVQAKQQVPDKVCFSPDGRFLGWLTAHHTVEVWDVERHRMAAAFRGHDDNVRGYVFTADSKRIVTASDDCTLLVWDVAGEAAKAKVAPAPTAKEVQAAWDDLALADAEKAFKAVRTMAAAPAESVPLIQRGLWPAAVIDDETVKRLLTDLDAKQFEDRERATRELKALGDRAERPLRDFLAGTTSAEARRRVEHILEAFDRPVSSPDRLRELRAVEVLERVGTETARSEQRRLAGGAADAGLTRDAAAALRRLGEGR
jgi:hypothetical protein